MYLSTVEIKNFRSIKKIEVDFQPGLNVVVGRNNTGKTNLLRAIRHALGPNASRGDALWLEHDDFYKASADDKKEHTIFITLTFAGLSESQRSQFYEIVDFDLTDLANSKAIIRFEASWPKGKRQASIKRTGGSITADPTEVPSKILDALPITFLPALRDAEAFLAPGVRSRLARLLQDLAQRKGGSVEDEIKEIYANANRNLKDHELIKNTKNSLQSTTKDIAGSDHFPSVITTAPANFDRILRSLQIEMDGAPIGALDANGLGYNNLLYIAVVLEHLKSPEPDENPLLLVEEPEAHLHPQLTMLLAEYLSHNTPAKKTPQTILTTHSPTLAAGVPPSCVYMMFTDTVKQEARCNSVAVAGMDDKELRELQRMVDITRATLYFSKASILVEGISESLLVPVLAKRLGYDLAKLHISVIPICGVAFKTFKKLLDPSVLGIPVAIVTDADPIITRAGTTWNEDIPEMVGIAFQVSDRTQGLLKEFDKHATVEVCHSKLTLEYDLADAGDNNAAIMAEVWESCFDGMPGTFNSKKVVVPGLTRSDKALATWRGICRADHSGSKAEFAHKLAAHLSEKDNAGNFKTAFDVPAYLIKAIKHVVENSATPLSPLEKVVQ